MFQKMTRGQLRTKRQPLGDQHVSCARGPLVCLAALGSLFQSKLHTLVALITFVALPALSTGLNDTGIVTCSNEASTSPVDCASEAGDSGSAPRQDARYGRDAQAAAGQLSKISPDLNNKGFDFTKISNGGAPLNASALLGTGTPDWACTRDNVTGLTWEVKTATGLRDQNSTYSWYKTIGSASVGSANNGVCGSPGRCDTEKFVADVNASKLCGVDPLNQWRLPTLKELVGIVDFGRFNPVIDPVYFPNTPTTYFWWTSIPDATYPESKAWVVYFTGGQASRGNLTDGQSVRLVRGPM